MGTHLFISYSRVDQGYVDRLTAALTDHGIGFWIDSKIDYGTRWPIVIREHIDTSAVVAVVMTPEAESSVWVGREIDQAEMTGRPLLPLLLRGQRFFRLAEHQFDDVRHGALPTERWFDHVRALTGTTPPPMATTGTGADRHRATQHLNRGDTLLGAGQTERALAELDRAVGFDPELATAHSGRGVALRLLGRWDDALAAYDRAIAIDPQSALAWHNRAVVLWHLGLHDEQLVAAEEAARLNPALDKAHNSRGLALQELGREHEALAAYARAIELNPRYFHAFNNRGTLHLDQGRYELALADFDEAVAIDSGQAIGHQNRGQALAGLGRSSESRAAYARAVELSD